MNLLPAATVVAALIVGVVHICFPQPPDDAVVDPDYSCEGQLQACIAEGNGGCFREYLACVGDEPETPPGTP